MRKPLPDRQRTATHGSEAYYRIYRCRCPLCVAYKAADDRAKRVLPCIDCGKPCWGGDSKSLGRCRSCSVKHRRAVTRKREAYLEFVSFYGKRPPASW